MSESSGTAGTDDLWRSRSTPRRRLDHAVEYAYDRRVRILFALLVVLVLALLAEAVFDSAIGAWVALGSVFAIAALRILGWVGIWPADWPDIFSD